MFPLSLGEPPLTNWLLFLSWLLFLRNTLLKKFRLKNPKILYGGSVNPKNVRNFKEINIIDGFLVGGASQDSKKFIDIVKKTFN